MTSITMRQAVRREEDDDHLTTEERMNFLRERGIEFTEENLDEVFVNTIF